MEVKDYLGKTGLARFLENCKKLFAPKADLEAHTSEANPHNITKTEVGLENVDNTSDADKPVSTAQAAAIAEVRDIANERVSIDQGTDRSGKVLGIGSDGRVTPVTALTAGAAITWGDLNGSN